jgi:hypothetical protein
VSTEDLPTPTVPMNRYLESVSYMHRFRRHAHRAARLPRRTWRRVYTYRKDRIPGYGGVAYTPISHDAPYDDQDARLWEWILLVMLTAVVVALIVAGIQALS